MPHKPPSPCAHRGCSVLVHASRCDRHKGEGPRAYDRQRASSTGRGYGYRWQRERAGYLREHPLCCECGGRGRPVPATEVDHIVPHRGDAALMWDRSNWRALCKPCHSRKTAREGSSRRG